MQRSLALLFVIAGCSHHTTTPTMSGNVTASGGTVSTNDGASVAVPADAVPQPTTITMGGEPNNVSVPNAMPVGETYRLGPEGMQFTQPVTVTLPFDASKLPSGTAATDIVIMTAPVGSTAFSPLPTTLVDATHVSAPTMHFSDFVAVVVAHDVDLATPVDLSVATSPPDLSTNPPDLSTPLDLSNPPDLSSPPDLTSACQQSFDSQFCTINAAAMTCGGHAYTLNCQQTMCICYQPNSNLPNTNCPKQGADANTLNCPNMGALEAMWTGCCGFPQQ
jgi:hypothetical protein